MVVVDVVVVAVVMVVVVVVVVVVVGAANVEYITNKQSDDICYRYIYELEM